jgi:peptide/nickel transport system permease protein
MRKNPVGVFAGLVCLMLVILAFIGPTVAPHDPNDTSLPRLQAPSLSYPLGTDHLFRDLFSRIIYGSRNSLGVGFASVGVSLVLGVVLGIVSGYKRGASDAIVGAIVNVMFSYPSLVLVIFLVTVFGQEFLVISIAIGLILTPYTIRVVRSAALQVSSLQYIEAATAVGASDFRIMYRHVLPNVTPWPK